MKDFHEWAGISESADLEYEKYVKNGQELVDHMMTIPLVYLVPALKDLATYVRTGGDKMVPVHKGDDPGSLRQVGDGPGRAVGRSIDPDEWLLNSKADISKRYNWEGLLEAFARVANQVSFEQFKDIFDDATYSSEYEDDQDAPYEPVEGDKTWTLERLFPGKQFEAASGKPKPAKTATKMAWTDEEGA